MARTFSATAPPTQTTAARTWPDLNQSYQVSASIRVVYCIKGCRSRPCPSDQAGSGSPSGDLRQHRIERDEVPARAADRDAHLGESRDDAAHDRMPAHGDGQPQRLVGLEEQPQIARVVDPDRGVVEAHLPAPAVVLVPAVAEEHLSVGGLARGNGGNPAVADQALPGEPGGVRPRAPGLEEATMEGDRGDAELLQKAAAAGAPVAAAERDERLPD